jgi:hypothetical protein
MCAADLRILACQVHWAGVLQIVVEGILGQMVIENVLLHFDGRRVSLPGDRVSIRTQPKPCQSMVPLKSGPVRRPSSLEFAPPIFLG